MRKIFAKVLVSGTCFAAIAASGCGKKDDDSTDDAAAENAAALVLELSTKIQTADLAAYSATSSVMKASPDAAFSPSLADNDMSSAYWTTAATIPNMAGGTPQFSSPKNFFDNQLDKDFLTAAGNGNSQGAPVGVMGRLKSNMDLACTLVYHLGTSGGLPAAQKSTLSITKAMMTASNAFCGASLELGVDSVDIEFTVTEITGSFSRHIHIKSDMFENHLFMFDDGTTKRILSTEVPDSEGLKPRWYTEYSSATKISRLEGFERKFITSSDTQQGTLAYYRLLADDSTKNVGIWGFYGSSKYIGGTLTLNTGTLFAGRGNKDQANATIGFAELDSGAQNGTLRSGHPYIGCIAMDTGSFASAGACSGFAMTATEMNSSLTMVKENIMAKSSSSDWKFDETMGAVGFTIADMTTLDPAL